jgi:hypothetical protein
MEHVFAWVCGRLAGSLAPIAPDPLQALERSATSEAFARAAETVAHPVPRFVLPA